MAEFHVKIRELEAAAETFEKLAPLLAQMESEVSSVKRGLSFQIRQRQRIEARLTKVSQRLSSQNGAMRRLAAAGKESAKLYQASEDKLVGMPERIYESVSSPLVVAGLVDGGDARGDKPKNLWDYLTEPGNFWKAIGEIGVLGKTASTVGKLISEGWKEDSLLDIAKSAVSIGGKVASAVGKAQAAKGTSVDWADLLLGAGKSKGAQTFAESFKDQIDKLNFGKAKNVAEGLGVGAKWAGYALTYVGRGLKNADQYTGAEFWGRTVAEGTIDIGLSVGTTAGLTAVTSAIATAAGVACPPALVIGVASAVVVAGGNALCKWATSEFLGKEMDIAQAATEGAIWLGGKAVDGAKAAADWVGNRVTDAAQWVGGTAQQAAKGIGNAAKSAWNTMTSWLTPKKPAYVSGGGW